MIRCVSCGADNHSFASFCIACGEPFDLPSFPSSSSFSSGHEPASALTAHKLEGESPARPVQTEFRRRATRETVLGLLVLVVALGFALYSWARDTEQSDAYRAGISAQEARDWNRAAAEFRRAGDHPGALTALSNAGAQIHERDRLYSDAQEAARREDWRTAARALERVESIQPDYKNTSRMLDFARERAQAPDLAGAIFLQGGRGTTAPGLYLMDAAGHPTMLPGSDVDSRVRARSLDGRRFVYDRPRGYDDYLVTGPGGLLSSALRDQSIHRTPVLATLTYAGDIVTRPLPVLDGQGQGVFTPNNLWWTADSTGRTYYVPLDSPGGAPSAVEVEQGGERLLAIDRRHDRAIFVTQRNGQTHIVGHDAGGTAIWLDQRVDGRIAEASVSPDGRWLLYLTEQPDPTHGLAVWVRLLDAGAPSPPSYPALLEQATATEVGEMPTLHAAFVPSTDLTGEVIVERTVEGRSVMTVYRLDTRAVTHRWTGASTGDLGLPDSIFSNAGAYLAVRRQYSNASILEVTRLTHANYVSSWYAQFPAPAGVRMLAAFTPADDFVLVGVEQKDGDPGISLFSAQLGGRPGLGRLTYLGAAAPSEQRAFPTVAVLSDPAAVVFVTPDGALRMAPASGKPPSHLATGVLAVWSLSQPAPMPWIGE